MFSDVRTYVCNNLLPYPFPSCLGTEWGAAHTVNRPLCRRTYGGWGWCLAGGPLQPNTEYICTRASHSPRIFRFRADLTTSRASTRRAEGARNAPPEPDEETRGKREGSPSVRCLNPPRMCPCLPLPENFAISCRPRHQPGVDKEGGGGAERASRAQ